MISALPKEDLAYLFLLSLIPSLYSSELEDFRYSLLQINSANPFESIYNISSSRNNPKSIFNTSTIRIAAVLGYDIDVSYKIENGSLRLTGGIHYESILYIADSYNLQVESLNGRGFAATTHNSNVIDSGTMLLNNECDVAISSHEFNVVRLSKFSYLHPDYESRLFGYFVQPPVGSIRDIFYHVFKYNLWITFLFTWLLVTSSIYGLTFVKRTTFDLKANESQSFTDILIWVVGVVCQNGESINPESMSLKIALICAALMGSLVYAAYSASITSILASDEVPIKDFSDMLSNEFTFYASSQTLSPAVERFISRIREKNPYLQREGQITKLQRTLVLHAAMTTEKSAVISLDEEFVRAKSEYTDKFLCSTMNSILLDRSPHIQSMLVKKGSLWKEYFNIKIVWEMETGILYRIKLRYSRPRSMNCLPRYQYHSPNRSLHFRDVFTAIAFFLTLYILSLLCFTVEKLLYLRKTVLTRGEKYKLEEECN